MTVGYECKLLPGEPIMLTTIYEGFDARRDTANIAQDMLDILDAAPEPVYMLDDLLHMKVSFSDLVTMLAQSTRGNTNVVGHRNVRKVVLVTENDIIRLGGSALKQSQYGGLGSVSVYPTVDDALSAIRAEMASEGAAVKSR